ncbi:MAG: GH3 auxin-responsive promoter, partial [Chitinophagaceae bacterium]
PSIVVTATEDMLWAGLEMASEDLNIPIPEFTVAGVPHGNFFAHEWFVATDDRVDATELAAVLDAHLKKLNDDYEVERNHALKAVTARVLPEQVFLDFMKSKGKVGGQHKFPRVVKGKMLEDWNAFLKESVQLS